jgi:outer membrane protein assembly factor BamD (BamD/ComL family)
VYNRRYKEQVYNRRYKEELYNRIHKELSRKLYKEAICNLYIVFLRLIKRVIKSYREMDEACSMRGGNEKDRIL